jgi:hypothetical protein
MISGLWPISRPHRGWKEGGYHAQRLVGHGCAKQIGGRAAARGNHCTIGAPVYDAEGGLVMVLPRLQVDGCSRVPRVLSEAGHGPPKSVVRVFKVAKIISQFPCRGPDYDDMLHIIT